MQIFYTVRRGDTLYNIASRWKIPLESLVYSNNLANPDVISPGMQLSMPPGVTTYEVKQGDTLYRISQAYGIPLDTVLGANNISPPYTIHPGDILIIPQGVPYYTVRKNDTLFAIARRYNSDSALIAQANDLDTPIIFPGMNLVIPYPPQKAFDNLASVIFDDINFYLIIYDGESGDTLNIEVPDGGPLSRVYASPDRNHFVYVNEQGVIYLTDKRTKELIALDQTYPTGLVSYTRDGSKIVYSNSNVIRIYDIKNGGFSTINRTGASYVQWFPDNSTLLFESRNTSTSTLYSINANGTNEKILFEFDNPMNDVRLSPNGQYVLFTSPGASISEIYVLEISSGTVNKLPSGREAKNYNPVWSKDSSKIAYGETVFENGKYYSRINITDPFGNNLKVITISNCFATPITWSPDSSKVAYMSGCRNGGDYTEIWAVDVNRPAPSSVLSGFTIFDIDI